MTFDRVDGYRVSRSLGYVGGSASQPRNRMRATFRSIGALIGLAPAELTTDAEVLRGRALDQLRGRADALGANAVLNLQFYASEGDDGACTVVAFGQAVVLEREGDAAR